MDRLTLRHALPLAALLVASSAQAGQTPPQAPGGPGVPGAQAPATPAPSATAARAFSAPVGLLFNTVRPERAADFEKLLAAVRTALDTSTDPTIQSLARGWRFFKAAEPGPNGSVLYVFVIDPTVPGEDYGLGRVLAQAYPDAAQLQEVWKLYTASVTGGGSLLNLSPPPPPAEPTAPAAGR